MVPSARLMGRADRARVGGGLETFWTSPNLYNCKFGDSVFRAVSVAIRTVVGARFQGMFWACVSGVFRAVSGRTAAWCFEKKSRKLKIPLYAIKVVW